MLEQPPSPALPSTPAITSQGFRPDSRLPLFMGAEEGFVESIASLYVAIIGTGSIGLNIALHATRLGIRRLLLCDHRSFKAESLLTHPLSPSAVGKKKASHARRLCHEINPAAEIDVFDSSVQSLPLTALADVDVVVMATDNLAAEVATGQLCQQFSKPLFHCSVHGETLVAHVWFFSNVSSDSPCPACLFGDAEMQQYQAETQFSCEGTQAGAAGPRANAQPTMSPSFLCALSASHGMTLLLRHALRLGAPVADSMVEYCGYTHRTVLSRFHRRADCPCPHTVFSVRQLGRPLGTCSFRVLAESAGFSTATSWANVSFEIDALYWVESAGCQCPAPRMVRRFHQKHRPEVGRCRRCRQTLLSQPFFTHDSVPAPMIRALFDTPLSKLGAAKARWAVVRYAGSAVFLNPSTANGGHA